MNKFTFSRILGTLGILLWVLTMFIRESSFMGNSYINFIAGIAPNIGAVWFFTYMIELFYITFKKQSFSFKYTLIALVSILVLGLLSEVVHDLFLNSPFDVNDIIASVLSCIIFAGGSFLSNSKSNNS